MQSLHYTWVEGRPVTKFTPVSCKQKLLGRAFPGKLLKSRPARLVVSFGPLPFSSFCLDRAHDAAAEQPPWTSEAIMREGPRLPQWSQARIAEPRAVMALPPPFLPSGKKTSRSCYSWHFCPQQPSSSQTRRRGIATAMMAHSLSLLTLTLPPDLRLLSRTGFRKLKSGPRS